MVNTAFATALQATVKDAYNNPLSGVTVTFTAPGSGASGNFANGTATVTASTNAQGMATAPAFTANSTQGQFTVTASVTGAATPASFSLTILLPPVISVSPTTIPFGNQALGGSSASAPVTISNTGAGALVISNLSITGSQAGDFSFTTIAGQPPITVNPNSSIQVNITFTPMNIGSRSAALSITDNASGSPHQVNLSGTGTAAIITFSSQNLSFPNQSANTTSAPLTLTLGNSSLANANLVITGLQLNGANAGEFAFTCGAPLSGSSCAGTLAPGATVPVSITFTPLASGLRAANLLISDNDNSHSGGTQTVTLSGTGLAPGITLPSSLNFGSQVVYTTAGTSLTITNPGNANLVIYSVTITGANASDFSSSAQLPITIAPNTSSSLPISFTPTNSGLRSASLSIYDNVNGGTQQNPHVDTVPLSGTGQAAGTLVMPPFSVGANLEVLATVGLNSPAASNLPVTITSADPTKVLLSTDATKAGSASVTLTVARLSTMAWPGLYVQSLDQSAIGAPDTVQLTVTAPGYVTLQCPVTLTPSALFLSGPNGWGQNFSTTATGSVALTVQAFELDGNGNLAGSAQMVGGGLSLSVSVSSQNSTVGTITGSPAGFAAGSYSVSGLSFQPVAAGSTQLSVAQPSGFSVPASGSNLMATVGSRQIYLNPTTVGYQLQTQGAGQLSDPAPQDLVVTVTTSTTPGAVLLSTSPTAAGSSQLLLTVPAGTTALPTFYVQGVAVGAGQLQASAAGYNFSSGNNNGAVAVTPSGFVLAGPSGVAGQGLATTLLSGDTPLTVTLMRLDSAGDLAETGILAGGVSVSLSVASGNPNVGSILNNPATFQSGDSSNTTLLFHPLGQGSSTLTVGQPSGFSAPASGGSLVAAVGPPQISLAMPAGNTIGANLQVPASGALNAPAPTGGLTLTLSSNNPNVLLSASATETGQSSISLPVAGYSGLNGIGFPTYYVQGLQSSGSATLTASAPGWVSGTIMVSLAPSSLVLVSPNGIGANFGTLTTSGATALTIQAMQLDNNNNPQHVQALAGGLSETVSVTDSNPGAGTITGSPVTIQGGSAAAPVQFQPAGAGTATLTVVEPGGFVSSTDSALNVTVN
jgi:hypothetical protein